MFKSDEAAVHLVAPVVVSHNGKETVAAVAGVKLKPKYLQQVLLDISKREASASELSCDRADELLCYLIDHQANVIASNQDLAVVALGERLGRIDPKLMERLALNESLFDEHVEHNYQALCPDDEVCTAAGVRSVVAPTINAVVYAVQNFYQIISNIGQIVVT